MSQPAQTHTAETYGASMDDAVELDFSSPGEDEADALSRDRVRVRSLEAGDVPALLAIDRAITRTDRSEYLTRQFNEAIEQSGIRVSLVAEGEGGQPVGFMMARVDFGEFGRTAPEAVMDTIGVDPDYARKGVGRAMMSQLLANLAGLQVERVRTEVEWSMFDLLAFLEACGFVPAQRLAFRRVVS